MSHFQYSDKLYAHVFIVRFDDIDCFYENPHVAVLEDECTSFVPCKTIINVMTRERKRPQECNALEVAIFLPENVSLRTIQTVGYTVYNYHGAGLDSDVKLLLLPKTQCISSA
jgi:hypothetical protein